MLKIVRFIYEKRINTITDNQTQTVIVMPKHTQKNRTKATKLKNNPKQHKNNTKHIKNPNHKTKHNTTTKQQKKQPKPIQRDKEEALARSKQLEESRQITERLQNKTFTQHIDTKVGANTSDILKVLAKAQKTDEDIATQLNMKVNDVRRALNIMNGYSIVKYDVNKDSKGWLMFKWKINSEKLEDYIANTEKELSAEAEPELPSNCNDFFICKKCYTNQKIVLPFETAFDSGFNCDNCGKPYAILSRNEAIDLFKTSQEQ